MGWREATAEEKDFIKKQYLPKEIVSTAVTGFFDLLLIALMVYFIVNYWLFAIYT